MPRETRDDSMTQPASDDSAPRGQACDPEWEVTPSQVRTMLDEQTDFLLLDCRKPEEDVIARIEGGRLVPMQELSEHLEELRAYEDRPVVVYCRSGQRSLEVTTTLRQQGFTDVKSMAGGILRWSVEIDPTIPQY